MPVPKILAPFANLDPFALLLTGSSLQALLSVALPSYYSFLPALALLLATYSSKYLFPKSKPLQNPLNSILPGRYTAKLPEDAGITVFVVGVSSNQYVFIHGASFLIDQGTGDFRRTLHADLGTLVRWECGHQGLGKSQSISKTCGKKLKGIGRSRAVSSRHFL